MQDHYRFDHDRYGYVYKTINLLNGKVYIGQHKSRQFNPNYYGNGLRSSNAINKHGKEHFKVVVVCWASSKEAIDRLERSHIARSIRLLGEENVYNIAPGGEGGCSPGKKAHTFGKHWKQSLAARKRRSITQVGAKNAFFGKHHTAEFRKKKAEGTLGNKNASGKRSLEAVKNMTGRKDPLGTRLNKSIAQRKRRAREKEIHASG